MYQENVFGGINKTFELELPGEFIDNTLFAFTASGLVRPDSNFTGMWKVIQQYTVHCACSKCVNPSHMCILYFKSCMSRFSSSSKILLS